MKQSAQICADCLPSFCVADHHSAAGRSIFLSSIKRTSKRMRVCKFKLAADGDAVRDPRDLDSRGLQETGNVHRGRLALGGRVGRNNDLTNVLRSHSLDQLAELDIVGRDILHRRKHTVKHVINALKLVRLFHCQNVFWLFDNTDNGIISI